MLWRGFRPSLELDQSATFNEADRLLFDLHSLAPCGPGSELAKSTADHGATIQHNYLNLLVPVERIELPTFGLQNRCSTAELNRRNGERGPHRAVAHE